MGGRTLKSFFLPGGALLLAAVALLWSGLVDVPVAVVNFYYYVAFAGGVLLAWRFHSRRILCALIALVLAHRAMEFFSDGRIVVAGPGRVAHNAMAVLLPLNFVLLLLVRERGLRLPAMVHPGAVLFFESIWVAIICRPSAPTGPWFLRAAWFDGRLTAWTQLPQLGLLFYAMAIGIFLVRFLRHPKPVESGLLWSLAATFLALQAGGAGRLGNAYFATAGLILASSIIENSYVLAYHDELTGLPSRRSFQEALLRLEAPYAIAMIDIDHFKNFNDSYGHDTGDQVLRMVAVRLAQVGGGGEAFRIGGEEFSILFMDKAMREAAPYLESLRMAVAGSSFRVRGLSERRTDARGPDRRMGSKRKRQKAVDLRQRKLQFPDQELSVTISIGVAEPSGGTKEAENVIQAADQALYRAKQAGRNRVETAAPIRRRAARLRRSTA